MLCCNLDEEFDFDGGINGDESREGATSYDVTATPPQKKAKSKSKLKRVGKKIRQDAEKLQIRALHQWFTRTFVNEMNSPLDSSSESYKSKYDRCSVF